MKEKVQLTENAMNSIENGAVLYEKDTKVESIALLVKGRVELVADGISMVLGTGNFLGRVMLEKNYIPLHIMQKTIVQFLLSRFRGWQVLSGYWQKSRIIEDFLLPL